MALLALLVTIALASAPAEGASLQAATPRCASGDPCCPPKSGNFCRVGCPPPAPTPLFQPAPDVTALESPQPAGIVIVEIAIDETGRTISACVLRSLRADADAAAQRAALRSTWTRKFLNGRPVGVVMTMTYKFPPPAAWTAPVITARSKLPLTRGAAVFIDPATSCPATGQRDPTRVGPGLQPPLLDYVEPHAPPSDLPGRVIVEVVIGRDGAVSNARILREVRGLSQLALNAVRQWRYARTCLNGTPVPVVITVLLTFGPPISR